MSMAIIIIIPIFFGTIYVKIFPGGALVDAYSADETADSRAPAIEKMMPATTDKKMYMPTVCSMI